MARDLDPILDDLDVLKNDLESDWDEFNDSEANLKRHSINYWKGLTRSIAASEKSTSNKNSEIKDVEEMVERLKKLGDNIKYHEPLPAYYHKEEKHFKKNYLKLISHIDKVKKAIENKKKSHLERVQIDLLKLVNEIKSFEKDDNDFFGKILKVRQKGLTRKSEIKEFLGDEFKGFWNAAKPYFLSHIKGHQGPVILKGFHNDNDEALTITAILRKRRTIYKKFISAASKLSKLAKKEAKYIK